MAVAVLLATAFVCMCAVVRPLLLPLAVRYRPLVRETAALYGLDATLVLALVNVESGFDADAVSKAGAVGLMQVMPATAAWIAELRDVPDATLCLADAAVNLDLGCWYLRYLMARLPVEWALAAYNAGEGAVEEWRRRGLTLDEIPYAETRAYVEKVRKMARRYRWWGL